MCNDGRPENLLIDRLLVPPVALRPSVDAGQQGSNEDDLTVKLSEILTVNNIIRNALEGGKATVACVAEDWEFLQLQTALISPHQQLKPKLQKLAAQFCSEPVLVNYEGNAARC